MVKWLYGYDNDNGMVIWFKYIMKLYGYDNDDYMVTTGCKWDQHLIMSVMGLPCTVMIPMWWYGYMVIKFWFMTVVVLKDGLDEYSHMTVKTSGF